VGTWIKFWSVLEKVMVSKGINLEKRGGRR
jgi:hypothetical protein